MKMRYERQLAIKDQTKKFSFLNDWNRHTIGRKLWIKMWF